MTTIDSLLKNKPAIAVVAVLIIIIIAGFVYLQTTGKESQLTGENNKTISCAKEGHTTTTNQTTAGQTPIVTTRIDSCIGTTRTVYNCKNSNSTEIKSTVTTDIDCQSESPSDENTEDATASEDSATSEDLETTPALNSTCTEDANSATNETGVYTNECYETNSRIEHYCVDAQSGLISTRVASCPNGCDTQTNQCKQTSAQPSGLAAICEDADANTDDGWYTASYTIHRVNGEEIKAYDVCANAFQLLEQSCDGDTPQEIPIPCMVSCQDAHCTR
ncbi:MAG: hypothetical protein V1722_01490 [Candidatus Micrarchaeota archaeon]